MAAVLQTFTDLLERASVDEAYMDITDSVNKRLAAKHPITIDQLKNTHVVGSDITDFIHNFEYEHHLENNLKLCMGGIIVEEIRAAVLQKTGENIIIIKDVSLRVDYRGNYNIYGDRLTSQFVIYCSRNIPAGIIPKM